ncbi:MAG: M56 family metallopeptidase [Nocardioidaceae bacterium]
MTVALLLLGYATALSSLGARVLKRCAWTARSPRLGIVAWLALTGSVVASVTLAGFALALPTVRLSGNLADLLHSCAMALRAQYATPGGAAAGATGAVLGLAVVARCLYCLIRALVQAVRARARQHQALVMVGRRMAGFDAIVVPHDQPAVYCLPGRGRRIVVTSGALTSLNDRQLGAALAHEHAHLAERHDLLLAWVISLARAFPRVPLFTTAENEVARLVEMLADDIATRHTNRLVLADALLALAGARTPVAALGAGGTTAACRVRRLLDPARPLGLLGRASSSVSAVALFAVPVLLFSGPAVAAMGMNYCPDSAEAARVLICAPGQSSCR